jgi:hypothetical protein
MLKKRERRINYKPEIIYKINLTEGKNFLYMMYKNKIDTLGIVPFWYYP